MKDKQPSEVLESTWGDKPTYTKEEVIYVMSEYLLQSMDNTGEGLDYIPEFIGRPEIE
jgi:hypothetical protein